MSLKGHAALVAVLTSAALTAARLLAISRFDVNTAATILQVSGTGVAIAGTALSLLPFALVLVVCVLAMVVFVDPTLLDLAPGRAQVALWVGLGATLCLAAGTLFVLTVLFIVVAAGVGHYLRGRGLDTDVGSALSGSRLLRAQATALLAVLVLTPIVLQRPWLPEQAVVLRGDTTRVGYLLGDADGRLAIMNEADRSVSFVDPEAVLDRYLCTTRPATTGLAGRVPRVQLRGSALGSVLWGDSKPAYPRCPVEPS
jgi:hypothetical protein